MAASAELFRRNGYTGTGLKQIVTEASAPFGSLYHFFPGGKEQLGEEVIRSSGMLYAQLWDVFFAPAPDVISGIESFFAGAIVTMRETDFVESCPIATVALEVATTSEPLRKATSDVFNGWIDTGVRGFTDKFGVPEEIARKLILAAIMALEGAFILSRSMRDVEPLAVAGESVVAMARSLLA